MTEIRVQVRNIMNRIRATVGDAIAPNAIRPLAMEAIDIIVKRTRLGYGVRQSYGIKERLPTLSERYVNFRRTYRKLSSTTSARKSNVTLTGDLLESIGIVRTSSGSVTIGALGQHQPGLSNAKLVEKLQKKGRYFLRVSDLEFKQLVRFYRKTFGDLLKKRKLIQ